MNKFFKRIVSMVGALALTAGLTASAAACSKHFCISLTN